MSAQTSRDMSVTRMLPLLLTLSKIHHRMRSVRTAYINPNIHHVLPTLHARSVLDLVARKLIFLICGSSLIAGGGLVAYSPIVNVALAPVDGGMGRVQPSSGPGNNLSIHGAFRVVI